MTANMIAMSPWNGSSQTTQVGVSFVIMVWIVILRVASVRRTTLATRFSPRRSMPHRDALT